METIIYYNLYNNCIGNHVYVIDPRNAQLQYGTKRKDYGIISKAYVGYSTVRGRRPLRVENFGNSKMECATQRFSLDWKSFNVTNFIFTLISED